MSLALQNASASVRLVEPKIVHEIADLLRQQDDFLIAGHLRPDGDCMGSCLGLVLLLRNMGKKVSFYTAGPVPEMFNYMAGFCEILTAPPVEKPSVCLCVDSAELERIADDFKPDGFVVNIDHHLSNTRYADVNWVDVDAAAAGEQIYRLALVLDEPITPEIATCLYTAIMTDTGGFRYSNTDQMVFRAVAHLVDCGAEPGKIAEAVFDSRKRQSVQLIGEIYASLKFEYGGKFVWNEITLDLFNRVGGEDAEPEGLASDIRGIEGVEVSVLFFETPEHYCRIGLRSRGKVNVSELAQIMGGGGHHNASGAMLREDYPAAQRRALDIVREYLKSRI